jgi:hypothetical protein
MKAYLLEESQQVVCQCLARELVNKLPLEINDVVLLSKYFHINAMFYEKGKSIIRGCNVDMNRWTCKTENGQVISISLG